MNEHELYMRKAIDQAKKAEALDEVPVGCVIVHEGKIIARGYNRRQTHQNPLEHAEIIAIQKAAKKLKSWRLEDCSLYVTLEPCPMCAGAIIQSRIPNVYFGAYDPKGGCVSSCVHLFETPAFNHHPTSMGGILEEECSNCLKAFFKRKRELRKAEKKRQKEELERGKSE